MKKRLISLLLAALMLFSLLPTAAFAGDEAVTEETAEEQAAEETPADAETAEEPAEEPAEDPVEEAAEEASEETAAPAEEQTAEEAADPAEEPTEEPEAALEGENILTAENFPDANLLAYLLEECSGSLTADGALAIKALYLEDLNISDFAGINTYFTALEDLYISGNPVKSLDISALSNLTTLYCSDCANLSSLTLPQADASQLRAVFLDGTAITSLELLGYNKLAKLDCQNCTALTSLKVYKLTDDLGDYNLAINISNTGITEIKKDDLYGVTYLCVKSSKLRSIDVSYDKFLTQIDCHGSSNLASIDCTGCLGLVNITAYDCALESVELSGCSALTALDLCNNRLSNLDLTDCAALNKSLTYLDNQFAGCSLTVWQSSDYANLIPGIYIDFPANGMGTPNTVGIRVSTYWDGLEVLGYNNRGAVLLDSTYAAYDFEDGSCNLSIRVKCTGKDNIWLKLTPVGQLKTGCPISVPEKIVLSTADAEGVQIIPSYSDGTPVGLTDGYTWVLGKGDDTAQTVQTDGITVKPLKAGHEYLTFELFMRNDPTNTPVMASTIEVDVVDGALSNTEGVDGERSEGSGVEAVNLKESQVSVELYKTDYTELNLVLQLQQNLSTSFGLVPEDDIDVPAEAGVAIESAEFTGDAGNWFDLVPTSDAKLKIVPKYEKIESVYNGGKAPGSFTTQVKVQLSDGGDPFTTGNLKITLKKTTPKVTVKPIVLNSWYYASELAVEPQVSVKPEAAIKDINILDNSLPYWADFSYDTDYGAYRVAYTGDSDEKHSANVKVEFELEGYAVKPQVTVKLSSKPTAPTIKASASKVTLLDNGEDTAFISLSAVMKGDAGDISYYFNPEIIKVTEGKNTVEWTYDPYYLTADTRLCVDYSSYYAIEGFSVYIPNSDGNKHTYKVYYEFADKPFTLTVNVLPAKTASKPSLTLKAVKNSGTLELTSSSDQFTGFTVSGKNCGIDTKTLFNMKDSGELSWSYSVYDSEGTDVSSQFGLLILSDIIYITLNDYQSPVQLKAGKYTFSLMVNNSVATDDGSSQPYVTGSYTFEIKQPFTKTVKLKSKGSLEAYKKSSVTISATSSDYVYLTYDCLEDYIEIYSDKSCSEDSCVTDDFYFYDTYNYYIDSSGDTRYIPEITIVTNDYYRIEPGTYYIRYENSTTGDYYHPDVLSAPLKLTVKGNLPKVTLSVKEAYLSSKNCNDTVYIDYTADSRRPLEKVEFADSKMYQYFSVYGGQNHHDRNDEGLIVINWAGEDEPKITLKAKTTKTVKLNLWYVGVAKPVTVSVKVVVK